MEEVATHLHDRRLRGEQENVGEPRFATPIRRDHTAESNQQVPQRIQYQPAAAHEPSARSAAVRTVSSGRDRRLIYENDIKIKTIPRVHNEEEWFSDLIGQLDSASGRDDAGAVQWLLVCKRGGQCLFSHGE